MCFSVYGRGHRRKNGILAGMVLYGTAHRLGEGITTELIIAPAHRTDDPAILAAHCLESVDPSLAERVAEGDLLLAGAGFGAGEGAEIAVLALLALGVVAVLCAGAAPEFVAVAATHGLPVLHAPAAAEGIPAGVVVRLDLERGQATDRASGAVFLFPPCSAPLIAAVRRGQLLARMRRVVEEEGYDG